VRTELRTKLRIGSLNENHPTLVKTTKFLSFLVAFKHYRHLIPREIRVSKCGGNAQGVQSFESKHPPEVEPRAAYFYNFKSITECKKMM
jgi:hypothetical protein